MNSSGLQSIIVGESRRELEITSHILATAKGRKTACLCSAPSSALI